MTPHEYIEATRQFDNHDEMYTEIPYVLGLAAEAGEIANEYERGMRNGRHTNMAKVRDELGDVLWQIARICDTLDWSFEGLMEMNIEKLTERYAREGIASRDDR